MSGTSEEVGPFRSHHAECARAEVEGQCAVSLAMGDLESFETCAIFAGNGNDGAACIKDRNTQGPEAGFSRLKQSVLDNALGQF